MRHEIGLPANTTLDTLRALLGSEGKMYPQPTQRLNGMRVLVVEDAAIQRECAMAVLADEGAHVVLANDGRQALDWLLANVGAIDVVLMDVQMPVMGGLEATRLIRDIPELVDLPVIALTAGGSTAQEDSAKAAGVTDFLPKPFDVEAVVAVILANVNPQTETAHNEMRRPVARPPLIDRQFHGIAIEEGISIWTDEEVYRQHLREFARDFENCAIELLQMERLAAARRAHEIAGIAGVLGLTEIAALSTNAERVLLTPHDPNNALLELQLAMHTVLESIRLYAFADCRIDAG